VCNLRPPMLTTTVPWKPPLGGADVGGGGVAVNFGSMIVLNEFAVRFSSSSKPWPIPCAIGLPTSSAINWDGDEIPSADLNPSAIRSAARLAVPTAQDNAPSMPFTRPRMMSSPAL
jgi:hypothetical protein